MCGILCVMLMLMLPIVFILAYLYNKESFGIITTHAQ